MLPRYAKLGLVSSHILFGRACLRWSEIRAPRPAPAVVQRDQQRALLALCPILVGHCPCCPSSCLPVFVPQRRRVWQSAPGCSRLQLCPASCAHMVRPGGGLWWRAWRRAWVPIVSAAPRSAIGLCWPALRVQQFVLTIEMNSFYLLLWHHCLSACSATGKPVLISCLLERACLVLYLCLVGLGPQLSLFKKSLILQFLLCWSWHFPQLFPFHRQNPINA